VISPNLCTVIPESLTAITDVEKSVRAAFRSFTSSLMEVYRLKPHILKPNTLDPFAQHFGIYLRSGLTHVLRAIRTDTIKLLAILICYPNQKSFLTEAFVNLMPFLTKDCFDSSLSNKRTSEYKKLVAFVHDLAVSNESEFHQASLSCIVSLNQSQGEWNDTISGNL